MSPPLIIVAVSYTAAEPDLNYRIRQPAAAMGQTGEVEFYEIAEDSRYWYDAALAADVFITYMHVEWEIFRVINQRRLLGKPTICEMDAILDVDPCDRVYPAWTAPKLQKGWIDLMRHSDVVQVTTQLQVERFASINPRVRAFGNHLARVPEWQPRQQRADEMVVGWMGSMGHTKDVQRLAPVLLDWMASRPQARLAIRGPKQFKDFFAHAPKDRFRFEELGSFEDWERFMRSLDVGLAPLQDTMFNRSRSDAKFLEYAAYGVVAVTQRLEPYQNTVRHGETGFLFSSDAELTGILDQLLVKPALRERVATAARDYVQRERLECHHARERTDFYRDVVQQSKRSASTQAPLELQRYASKNLRTLPHLTLVSDGYWRLESNSPAELKCAKGVRALKRGDSDTAVAAFIEAVRLAPDYYQAHQHLGRCFARRGNISDAVREFKAAVQINPFYSMAWLRLSKLRRAQAKDCERQYRELNPML